MHEMALKCAEITGLNQNQSHHSGDGTVLQHLKETRVIDNFAKPNRCRSARWSYIPGNSHDALILE
jgi:hypothetical protein